MFFGRLSFKNERVEAVDWVRGLAMILMALGHSLVFIRLPSIGEEFPWFVPNYPTYLHFISRFLTHYAPTTFLFLAGASVIFASEHRIQKKSSESLISLYFLKRGIIFIILQFTIVNFAFSWGAKHYFGVLSMIGTVIIVLSLFRLVPGIGLILLSCGLMIATSLILRTFPFQPEASENFFCEILLYANIKHGSLWVRYPVLPWLTVGLLGCGFGKALLSDRDKAFRWAWTMADIALVLFVILRLTKQFGNLHEYQGGNLIDFLVTSKYPPSICFLLWTLAGMAIALSLLHLVRERKFMRLFFWNVVALFGKVPLFFYIVHVWVYKYLPKLLGLPPKLGWAYVLCILGLFFLYYICRGYLSLKHRYHSILQYF